MAPGAVINGKLNFENTANFGGMIHTERSNWRYKGLLVSRKVTVRFELDLVYIFLAKLCVILRLNKSP